LSWNFGLAKTLTVLALPAALLEKANSNSSLRIFSSMLNASIDAMVGKATSVSDLERVFDKTAGRAIGRSIDLAARREDGRGGSGIDGTGDMALCGKHPRSSKSDVESVKSKVSSVGALNIGV